MTAHVDLTTLTDGALTQWRTDLEEAIEAAAQLPDDGPLLDLTQQWLAATRELDRRKAMDQ